MFKKIMTVFFSLAAIAALAAAVFLYWQGTHKDAQINKLQERVSQLQVELSAIEESVPVYALKEKQDRPGVELKEEDIKTVLLPISAIPMDAITDSSFFKNLNYLKVASEKGTILTKSMFTKDRTLPRAYFKDLSIEVLPVNLETGDYIDLRIAFPFGEDYTIASSLRVYEINSNVATVKMDKEELIRYKSAEKDQQLLRSSGAIIYAVQVADPAVQNPTAIDYPVRNDMAIVVQADKDIKDKNEVIRSTARAYIEQRLAIIAEEAMTEIRREIEKGVSKDSDRFLKAYEKLAEKKKAEAELKALQRAQQIANGDVIEEEPLAPTLEQAAEHLKEVTENIDKSVDNVIPSEEAPVEPEQPAVSDQPLDLPSNEPIVNDTTPATDDQPVPEYTEEGGN